jgi:membrane protease YdiL (CAAX protease family)
MSLRSVRVEPADIVRAAIPLALLFVAVAFPSFAGVMLVLLAGGAFVAAARMVAVAWSWAAAVPAATIATLREFGPASDAWQATSCTDLASPLILWSLAEVTLVVATVAVLAMLLSARPADLGLRRLPKYATPWAVVGFAAILLGGLAVVLVVGPLLARMGTGDTLVAVQGVDPQGLGFVVPAVVFALAIAVSEELAWRGALQGWLARSIGPWPAVLTQAAIYGVAWGVLLGAPLVGIVAAASGAVLGATVARTRSIGVALAWHVAFNVPFYLVIACQAA